MLIEAVLTAAGDPRSEVFKGLPPTDGFQTREHIKEGEVFEVNNSLGKSKLALRSGATEADEGSPIFREVVKVTE